MEVKRYFASAERGQRVECFWFRTEEEARAPHRPSGGEGRGLGHTDAPPGRRGSGEGEADIRRVMRHASMVLPDAEALMRFFKMR